MQVFIFPMFFLSGAFFPLNTAPSWMQWISKINPLTYGVDAMRQIILGSQVDPAALAKITFQPVYLNALFLAIFAVVMMLISVVAFRRKD